MPNNELKAAGIGAAGGIAGGLINGIFSQIAAKQQYNRQLDFWGKQNRYNSPQAQRDRLNAAGFNPSAAMEQVAGSNTAGELSSVPGNEVAKNGILDPRAISDWFHAFADLENTVAGTQHLTAQVGTELTKQLINNLEAAGLKIDNKTKELLYEYADDQQKAQLDKLAAETKAAEAGAGLATEQATTESVTREAKKANIESSTALNEALTADSNELRSAKLSQIQSNVAQAAAEIERIGWDNLSTQLGMNSEVLNSACTKFFGIDMSALPGELRAYAQSLMCLCSLEKDDGTPALTVQAAYESLGAQIDRYVDKNGRYPVTESSSTTAPAIGFGKFKIGGASVSGSKTQ